MSPQPNFIDLTGKTFGRLTVIARGANTRGGQARWICTCACGGTATVRGRALRAGTTKSCGCISSAATTARNHTRIKHGHTTNGRRSRAYVIWCGMLARCYKLSSPSYPNYGGRGITVCDQWRESFDNFLSRVQTLNEQIDNVLRDVPAMTPDQAFAAGEASAIAFTANAEE